MPKSAPSPKKKTNPLVWVGLAVVVFGVYTAMSGGDEPAPTTSKTKKKTSTSKDDALYTDADKNAKFALVSYGAKDVFNPLIKKAVRIVAKDDKNVKGGGIAQVLTGGEANWYYTGYTTLDGVRQALLENTVSGETAYVGVGDAWKAAKIVSIDVGVVEMSGPNGMDMKVPITPYGEMPGVATPTLPAVAGAAPQPLNVPGGALNGAIGGIGVRPVPGPQANGQPSNVAATGQPDPSMTLDNTNNSGNGRNRRGRRNRNNTQSIQGFNNVP